MKPPISGLGRDVREESPLPNAPTHVPVLQDRRNVSDYAVLRVRESTHAGAMLGSITSMSSVTVRQAYKSREEDAESETRRTVYGVVAYGVANLLDHALPANVLRVPGVRDDPAELAVVVVDLPAVDSSADADVLRARDRQLK